jgi:ribonuclease HI
MILLTFTDGAARGNPGPAGCGVVLADEKGKILATHKKFIGTATNNVAEYQALAMALEEAKKMKDISSVRCYADSKLMVEQVNGNFKVKNKTLIELHEKVRRLVMQLPPIEFFYIPREKNAEADRLANEAIDGET